MRRLYTLFLFILCSSLLLAQQRNTTEPISLLWEDTPRVLTDPETGKAHTAYLHFEGALHDGRHPQWPQYQIRIPLQGPGKLQVNIQNATTDALPQSPYDHLLKLEKLPNHWNITTQTIHAGRQWYAFVTITPLRKTINGYERLRSFQLNIKRLATTQKQTNSYNPPVYSRLADGEIYKLAISKQGIHKITYNFLKNELGLTPEQIDPRKIEILGIGGGMLPQANSSPRYEDLEPCAIYVKGEEDGSFNTGDYILFYAQAAGVWEYDEDDDFFNFITNLYDTKNYYFLKIGSENGLRITEQNSINGDYFTDTYDDHAHHEEELFNLLNSPGRQGSGRYWFGEYFYIQRDYTFSFNLSGRITSDSIRFEAKLAARSPTETTFSVSHNNTTRTSESIEKVILSDLDGQYAFTGVLKGHFFSNSNPIDLTVTYPLNPTGDNEGWLDYLTVNVRRRLTFNGSQMNFRDKRSRQYASTTFSIAEANSNLRIWNVSDPLKPIAINGSLSANNFTFGIANNYQIAELTAFDESQNLLQPEFAGKIPNQNLHGISDADMIILYHTAFADQVEQLAQHRRTFSNLQVETVPIDLVYNEFSSGRQDPTAIRDFMRMIFQRNPDFRYLLLFGDGSYDFRNITGTGSHYIPTFQTTNSLHSIHAFPSDDYYGLLHENEGANLNGGLDIAIGRLPVQNAQQAQDVIDKIFHYETSPATVGDWRLRTLFVADDEDGATHLLQADGIAQTTLSLFPFLNVDKLYLDAYQQIATSFGQRSPSMEKALDDRIFQGVLTVTYMGHGGWKGWAQERILQNPQINSWENYDKLPLFITATCSFAGFDDPVNTTAGELVLFNPKGGGCALFTTVRPVFASENEVLTRKALEHLYQRPDGLGQPLGLVLMNAKNSTSNGSTRKFFLLGDPAMRLALPQHQIVTTAINGQELNSQADTLSALEQITISGEVRDLDGQLIQNFNGTIYPTVFDKTKTYQTLGQDGTPVQNYQLQKNLLFRGKASVQNGTFSFTFIAPKDLNYAYGPGKISYYAADQNGTDAGGYFNDLIIGGINPNAINDDTGPQVEVYMNSEDFVFGGLTGPNPLLLVKLQDDLGINVVGNSVGHDLTAILDDDSENTFLLNNFYEAELNDHTRGSLRYPLENLSEGRHSITVKAWDVANNSAEGYTEFIVAGSEEIALQHVLNYPNPFTNSTCFQFEHNMEGAELDIRIDIYTITGRLVKSLHQKIYTTGSRLSNNDCLQWDGTDDFGTPLAKGVYVYKINVALAGSEAQSIRGESKFEKLVILR